MTIGEHGKIRAVPEIIGEKNRQPEYAGLAEMACTYQMEGISDSLVHWL